MSDLHMLAPDKSLEYYCNSLFHPSGGFTPLADPEAFQSTSCSIAVQLTHRLYYMLAAKPKIGISVAYGKLV